MPYLRRVYGFAGAAAACAHIFVRFASPVSLTDVFFQDIRNPLAAEPVMQSIAKFLRYDQITTFSASAIWTMLTFRDLKKAGKLTACWGRIIRTFAGITLVAGPGAAMAAIWAWREETLAKREVVVIEK
jgi:hypothetical protein